MAGTTPRMRYGGGVFEGWFWGVGWGRERTVLMWTRFVHVMDMGLLSVKNVMCTCCAYTMLDIVGLTCVVEYFGYVLCTCWAWNRHVLGNALDTCGDFFGTMGGRIEICVQ